MNGCFKRPALTCPLFFSKLKEMCHRILKLLLFFFYFFDVIKVQLYRCGRCASGDLRTHPLIWQNIRLYPYLFCWWFGDKLHSDFLHLQLMAHSTEPSPPLCPSDQISMTMTLHRKQLHKLAPLSISLNKANMANRGVNIHLLNWRGLDVYPVRKESSSKYFKEENVWFAQTLHSTALCRTHHSLSSSLFTSDYAAARTAAPRTGRTIHQRRLFDASCVP